MWSDIGSVYLWFTFYFQYFADRKTLKILIEFLRGTQFNLINCVMNIDLLNGLIIQ